MIGHFREENFDPENYENFYEHHNFQPMGPDDAVNVHEVIPRFGWAYDVVEELCKPDHYLRVLDLGCLEGSFILTLCKHLPVVGTGVDLTSDGIKIAIDRAEEHGLKASFRQGTIEAWLEYFAEAGEKFDVVTCFEVMEHVKDPELVLRLIDKVLAPKATVLISTPDFEDPVFGKDDEKNKCHIRLYTTAADDYTAVNKYGTTRLATSITNQIGPERIVDMEVISHLINVRYE